MPRTMCTRCGRNVAAIPAGLAGRWNAARHDGLNELGHHRDVLVSCTGSLKPVSVEDLVYQLAFNEVLDDGGLTLF